MALSDSIEHARKQVDTSPTDGQIKAGNYKKGHFSVKGMVISIENPRGSYRCGTDKGGHKWRTLMHYDYGYFVKTVGKDGDAIDVFLGPNLDSEKVYCVDQYLDGKFDETKVMLGFNSKEEAKAAYFSNYEKGWKGFGDITEVDVDKFKKWLYDGYRQRKAFADYTRLYEAEEKFSIKDKIMLREEEYNQEIVVYTGDDCKGVFNYLCSNGFSRYDLNYDPQGGTISVTVEKDRTDDDYADDVIHRAKDLVDEYLGGAGYGNVMEKVTSKKPLSEAEMRAYVKESIMNTLKGLGNNISDKFNKYIDARTNFNVPNEFIQLVKDNGWDLHKRNEDGSVRIIPSMMGVSFKEMVQDIKQMYPSAKLRSDGDYCLAVKLPSDSLSESEMRATVKNIIRESLEEVLDTPETAQQYADKAKGALGGFKGKMMKTFRPKHYDKIKAQGERMQDYADNHPTDDVEKDYYFDIMKSQHWYNRNKRTGDVGGNNPSPFRGNNPNLPYGKKIVRNRPWDYDDDTTSMVDIDGK